MPEVVIVGGGVIGCATAYFLSKQGAKVTLLERAELASEASGASAGMLAALSDEGGERGPAFQALCLDSLKLYKSLLPELEATGIDLRYRRTGVLHLALNEDEARHLRKRFDLQRKIAPESHWLEGDEVRRQEPDASLKATAALLSPMEHYVDSQRLTLAFAEAARHNGADIRPGEPLRSFVRNGSSLRGVRSAAGRYDADAVVLSAGPWTADLAGRLGANVPVRPVRGQMLSLKGPRLPLRHVIWGSGAYLVPREDGQTFVGATVEEVGFRKRTTAVAQRSLRARAAELVPAVAAAELLRAWSGLRPATPDALPVLGLLPGWSNVWVSTGHFRNGILLAPISGQVVAESVMAGEPASRLKPFSPERFAE